MTAKEKKIKELFNITQSKAMYDFVISNTISTLQNIMDIPVDYANIVERKINKDQILEALIPVYDKYYTESDLDEMIDFHQSLVGRKILTNQLSITQESVRIINELSEIWMADIIKELDDLEESESDKTDE